jgi:hypothetical protein
MNKKNVIGLISLLSLIIFLILKFSKYETFQNQETLQKHSPVSRIQSETNILSSVVPASNDLNDILKVSIEEDFQLFEQQFKTQPNRTGNGTLEAYETHIWFWLSRLESSENRIKEEAFQVFVHAAYGNEESVIPSHVRDEVKVLQRFLFLGKQMLATPEGMVETIEGKNTIMMQGSSNLNTDNEFKPFPNLIGFQVINKLVEKFAPFALESDKSDNAMKILTTFTFRFYQEKSPEWWNLQYKHSKIAAIINGVPMSRWAELYE